MDSCVNGRKGGCRDLAAATFLSEMYSVGEPCVCGKGDRMNEIGIAVINFDDLEKIPSLGFDYIEVMGKSIAAAGDLEFQVLRERIVSLDLKVYGLNAFCSPQIRMIGAEYDREAVEKYCKTVAERAAAIGAKIVGIGSPRSRILAPGYPKEKAEKEFIDFLTTACAACSPYGIRVCVEPLAGQYCNFVNTLEEALHYVDVLKDREMGIIADLYNMELDGRGDEDLSELASKITHIHTSDDDGSIWKRSYLDPERAEIHIRRIRDLVRAGYRGNLTLETDLGIECSRAAGSLEILHRALE
jgi:sugar phosphate isomerase/epimerase